MIQVKMRSDMISDDRKEILDKMDYNQDDYWSAIVDTINKTDIDVIDALNNTNPDAKEEFLARKDLSKPHNHYGNMDIKQVEWNIDTIISLQRKLELSEFPEKKKTLAGLVLDNNLKRNRFITANYLYHHADPGGREDAVREHKQANVALWRTG